MTTSVKQAGTPQIWTNEKHVDFLNSMEASFVRTMFERNNNNIYKYKYKYKYSNGRIPQLRLDRYLPDSSDSTQDSNVQRRRKRATPEHVLNQDTSSHKDIRTNNKTRRLSSQQCKSSHDQMVPQVESKRVDKVDESDQPDVPIAPAN